MSETPPEQTYEPPHAEDIDAPDHLAVTAAGETKKPV